MAQVKRNQSEIRKFLNGAEIGSALVRVAGDIAGRARAIGNGARTGYGSGVSVSRAQPNGGVKRDRNQVTITAAHPSSAAVEFGNRRTSASRPLRRASGR